MICISDYQLYTLVTLTTVDCLAISLECTWSMCIFIPNANLWSAGICFTRIRDTMTDRFAFNVLMSEGDGRKHS